MNLDDLLSRYFGADDPSRIASEMLDAGIERLRVDLGVERDRGRRFALWTLLYMLGAAPDPDRTFERPDDREAARDLMATADRAASA